MNILKRHLSRLQYAPEIGEIGRMHNNLTAQNETFRGATKSKKNLVKGF
jgi:hypothetical protein